eukprot:scaffold17.g510.t1
MMPASPATRGSAAKGAAATAALAALADDSDSDAGFDLIRAARSHRAASLNAPRETAGARAGVPASGPARAPAGAPAAGKGGTESEDEFDIIAAAKQQRSAAAGARPFKKAWTWAAHKVRAAGGDTAAPAQSPGKGQQEGAAQDAPAAESEDSNEDRLRAARRQPLPALSSTPQPEGAAPPPPQQQPVGPAAEQHVLERKEPPSTVMDKADRRQPFSVSEHSSGHAELPAVSPPQVPPLPLQNRPATAASASTSAQQLTLEQLAAADLPALSATDLGPSQVSPAERSPPPRAAEPLSSGSASARAARSGRRAPAPLPAWAPEPAAESPPGAAAGESPGPLPPPPVFPSLAELGGLIQQSVAGAVGDLRMGIHTLESALASSRQEQSAATAELRGTIERMQARAEESGREVRGCAERLGSMAQDAAALRARLDEVERRQAEGATVTATAATAARGETAAAPAPVPALAPVVQGPAAPAPVAPVPWSPGKADDTDGLGTLAILRRLSLLEDRVAGQLRSLAAGEGAAPASRPASEAGSPPRRPASPRPGPYPRPHSVCSDGGCQRRRASPASAARSPSGLGRQQMYSGAGAVCGLFFDATQATEVLSDCEAYGGGARGRPPGGSSRAEPEVNKQIQETHALVAGIQAQIASIKSSLLCATSALGCSERERGSLARRVAAVEGRQRNIAATSACAARLDAATVDGVASLGKRLAVLEQRVADVQREATSGAVRLGALEWRVDRSAEATVGALQASEARQDKLRTELRSVGATAMLAEARAGAMARELGCVERRLAASPARGARALFSPY